MKTHIGFNTHQRSWTGSSFLNDFFELTNNSVFGKRQNLRKRVHVELITDAGILRKRVPKPNFCRGNPITDCLTAIQCTVATLTLNRPIYVGFSVLHLSKLHMSNFHYNHMCVKYQVSSCDCCSRTHDTNTDTNRLCCSGRRYIYRDMAEDAATHYDFSEYPLDHPLYRGGGGGGGIYNF